MNNEVLLYSTSNYIQSPGINYNEKEYKKQCIYVYNQVTLLYSRINIVNYSSTKNGQKMGKREKLSFVCWWNLPASRIPADGKENFQC